MSATSSGLGPLPGRSARIVASAADDGTLPMATPPSFTKSLDLRSRTLPAPTTTSRETSSPAGATMSRVEAFLPLNRSAEAARVTRSPVGASALRAADPNLSPSSQNTMRTPLAGAENGVNSSFRVADMRFLVVGWGVAGRCYRTGGSPRFGGRYDPLGPNLQSP